ncbi:MAG: Fic family protein [Clostridia bacterium]|nr:Fic family protein [Clostridia bacterium]MBQ6121290.1 Fic family protein [Clostridia bacterium]
MNDPYLIPGTSVLKNKLNLTLQPDLDEAEADYAALRLRELAVQPLPGNYGVRHYLSFHRYIFQDLYNWAGEPRRMNIMKEEPALGGLSVEYTDYPEIRGELSRVLSAMRRRPWERYGVDKLTAWFSHDMAALWKIHTFREGNTRTTIHFCCQFSDEHGFSLDRGLFEENSHYFRTALVAYNAVFSDIGDKSRKEYLERIMRDAIERGMGIYRQKG